MRLSEEQQETAIAVRALLKSEPDQSNDVAWEAYIDFTRAIAKVLDDFDHHISPVKWKAGSLDPTWGAYCKAWVAENERIIRAALDDDEALYEQVNSHPKRKQMMMQICQRVKEKNGSILGVTAEDVDVTDIIECIAE